MGSYTASTSLIKPSEVQRKWWIVDASKMTVGRIAARVAMVLRGKHKPSYTPYIDCGDYVIIINCQTPLITGKSKRQSKTFFWHTGYAGGIKEITWDKILTGKYPERLMHKAIQRMLPKESPLARQQLKRLYLYCGNEHPHMGQTPEILTNIRGL